MMQRYRHHPAGMYPDDSGVWCQLREATQEVEQLTKERDKYKEVLRICSREAERQLRDELHRIRNQSLEWAMVCTCNCPACCALYETIKGSSGHPKTD